MTKMSDIYEQILAGQGSPADKRAMTARSLRREEDLGTAGMLTGNSVMMTGAKSIRAGASEKTAFLAKAIEAELQRRHEEKLAAERNRTVLSAARMNQNDQKEERRLQKFSTDLQKDGIPEAWNSMMNLTETLGQYRGKNIPGIGGVSNIPLLGSVLGGKEGRQMRSDLAAVANALLKARSGAAVTDQEERRFLEEVQTGSAISTDADFLGAYERVLNNMEAVAGTLFTGAGSVGAPGGLWDQYGGSFRPGQLKAKWNSVMGDDALSPEDQRIAEIEAMLQAE
jgi:hypothetical protein